jgi:hypothetical protein
VRAPHHLLQPPVFVFQLAEFITSLTSIRHISSAIIKRGIRDAVLAAELLDTNADLGLLQDRDDLFLSVPFPCHSLPLWAPISANSLVFGGKVRERRNIGRMNARGLPSLKHYAEGYMFYCTDRS